MKKNRNISQKPLAGLAGIILLAGLAGCAREGSDIPAPPEGEKVNVEFRLGVEAMKSAVPRSATKSAEADGAGLQITFGRADEAATRSDTEETINHLWVFQYAKSGKSEGQLIDWAQIESTQIESESESGDGMYAFSAELAWSDDCEIIVVANSANFGFDETLTSLSAARTKIHRFSLDNAPDDNHDDNPMAGVYTGPVPNDYLWVPMTRLKAKISLKIQNNTSKGTLTLQSVQLKSVATESQYYDRAGQLGETDWIYPEVIANQTVNTGLFVDYTECTTTLNQTISWYLPENRQGNAAPEITTEKDKWIENSPAYATHIVIIGEYADGTDRKKFTITFFPGDQDNPVNNFDIVRNNHYIITATITNFDPDDKRIKFL